MALFTAHFTLQLLLSQFHKKKLKIHCFAFRFLLTHILTPRPIFDHSMPSNFVHISSLSHSLIVILQTVFIFTRKLMVWQSHFNRLTQEELLARFSFNFLCYQWPTIPKWKNVFRAINKITQPLNCLEWGQILELGWCPEKLTRKRLCHYHQNISLRCIRQQAPVLKAHPDDCKSTGNWSVEHAN